MVGYPTESYGYGTIILWYSASGIIPVIMACVYYIPLIHRLQLWSIYEVGYTCAFYIHFQMDFSSKFIFARTIQLASFILGYFVLNSTWSDASTNESAVWNLL